MFRLTTFGTVTLSDDSGQLEGAPVQRRRLALLARLAAAGQRGVSRELLGLLLWPESDAERARHNLRQWLSLMRRDLGADELLLGTTELRLNPRIITSDVGSFREASAGGDLESAAALYTGPFLDGFHVSDAPEFERWVDEERSALSREAARTFEALADRATAKGAKREAATWWRRVVDLDPLSAHAAIEYMTALAGAGERATALEFAREHETLLRSELGVAPDPRLPALVRDLRQPDVRTDVSRGNLLEQRLTEMIERAFGGAYRVVRTIERTALATLFEVHDRHSTARLLRVLSPAAAAALDVSRWTDELARAIALRHHGLVPLLDVGARDGIVYLVTPVVVGENLRDRLTRERPLGLVDAVRIASQVAEALTAAHDANVLHLDLKPRHIVLAGSDVLVGDVGVAPAMFRAATDVSLRSGVTIGTPAYLSPEQVAGTGTPDARSDVYALGCTIYHMLAGEPPFGGGAAQTVLIRRLSETPAPLRTVRPRIPTALDAFVARMLERIPGDRIATMREVRDGLEGIARSGVG